MQLTLDLLLLATLGACLLALPGAASARPRVGAIHASRLRCEYLVDPMGVDEPAPRLSWVPDAAVPQARGVRQSAYRVLVAGSPRALRAGRGDLWDSGRVASDATAHVVYAGKPLPPGTPVFWKVRLWDGAGAASAWSPAARWHTGLMRAANWKARWVGGAVPPDAEPRPAHNGFHGEVVGAPDQWQWVQIDLGARRTVDAVHLFPARPFDFVDTPGFLFPLRFRVEAGDRPDMEDAAVVVDRTAEDVPSPGLEAPIYRFAPIVRRYVRLAVTRLRQRDPGHFSYSLAEMQVLSEGRNVAAGAEVTASGATETGAWSLGRLVDGDNVSHRASALDALPAAQLRREFALAGGVRRAVAFVSALGVYELRINGRRVGDHVLAPEWTDYSRRVQYQTYDVTKLLRAGPNAVGILLGDGWYAGRLGLAEMLGQKRRALYGRMPACILQLEIEREDGGRETWVTDGSWRYTTEGPVRVSDMLDGEYYDARREVPGWDRPGYAAVGWKPVATSRGLKPQLVAQPNEPIRVVERLRPVAVTQPRPGVYIFDMGQNMVGWARLRLRGRAGRPITIRHAEMLNDDGTLYTQNLRGAPSVDTYVPASARPAVFEPHFTYHGFRYVEVSGVASPPTVAGVEGRVFCSAAPRVGRFACSNPMLTRLWENIFWTARANLMSVPTDCPQRDERLGWMGDIQAFAQTGVFQMDLAAFFTKWLQDVRDAQTRDGRFPEYCPYPYGNEERAQGVPAWGDAGVLVPWTAWVNYGDRRLLERHFAAAARWVDYIHRHNPDLTWSRERGADFNDWLNGDTLIADGWPRQGGTVPPEVLATAFFTRSAELVSRMAGVLGKTSQARRYGELAAGIRAAFNRAYVSEDGVVQGDTQAGYALALAFDLLPEPSRSQASRRMAGAVAAYGNHISTGIQTTHRLMLELTRWGRGDLACVLANNRTFPSWGYTIDNGATTIWERWDGYVKGRGFQDPGMNSFNHWALGAVGEWMMRAIAGLEPEEDGDAWRRFTVRPRPGGDIAWARASYDSIRGLIGVEWSVKDGQIVLDVRVPANTTATVWVPTRDAGAVREGGRLAAGAPGVAPAGEGEGAARFRVGSGSYRFVAPWTP